MKDFFFMLFSRVRFWLLKHKADAMHDATGKRYYVIPCGGKKLLIACNNDIKLLKKRGVLKRHLDHLTIMENCLYYTDCDGKNYGKMSQSLSSENERQWLSHLRRLRKK